MELDVLALAGVVAVAIGSGALARRLGQPAILGELVAGIIVGPALLGWFHIDPALTIIGQLGVVLLMFYIGLHLDLDDMRHASSGGLLAAVGGLLVPAAAGYFVMQWFGSDLTESAFVALAMGVTALATKSRILLDLELLTTRIGHVLMAGAVYADVAAVVLFTALLGIAASGAVHLPSIAGVAVEAVVFVVGAAGIGVFAFPRIAKRLAASNVSAVGRFAVVILIALAFGGAAELLGLHAILGTFFAGLFFGASGLPHHARQELQRSAHAISIGFLAPVFFVVAGFQASFDVVQRRPLFVATVLIVATMSKIVGVALFYLPTGRGWREGVVIGTGMNGRGAVEIIVAEIAFREGLISVDVFSLLVFMAIFTTAADPILLTRAVRWLRRHQPLVRDNRNGVVILGGGPVALRMATALQTAGSSVTIVDTNANRCEHAEDIGFTAVCGNGLDIATLEAAGVKSAQTFIAVTSNTEVNVLASQLAADRFDVPSVHAAMAQGQPPSLYEMLSVSGCHLLFGRAAELALWDAAAEEDRVEEVSFLVTEPTDLLEHGSAYESEDAELRALPLLVKSRTGVAPYSSSVELTAGNTVIALTRAVPDSFSQRQQAQTDLPL